MKYMKNVKLYVVKEYFFKCQCPHYLHQRLDHHQCLMHLCTPHLHGSPYLPTQKWSNHCFEFRVAYFFAFYISATYVYASLILYCRVVPIFWTLCRLAITLNVFFWDFLFLSMIIILRFIHVYLGGCDSYLFVAIYYSVIWAYHCFWTYLMYMYNYFTIATRDAKLEGICIFHLIRYWQFFWRR